MAQSSLTTLFSRLYAVCLARLQLTYVHTAEGATLFRPTELQWRDFRAAHHGVREARYAAIDTISSTVRLATAAVMSCVAVPARAPFWMS